MNAQVSQITKQGIDFQKMTIDNLFMAAATVQDQAASATNLMLDQATWLPPEGRAAVENWVTAFKIGRGNYKKYMDESYKKVMEFFAN